MALRGSFEVFAVVAVAGFAVAILLNVVLVIRMRTTQATWAPGTGAGVLRAALQYVGIEGHAWVGLWEAVGAVAIVLNLVALLRA
ncbi:MAG: hypothetical protein R3290_09960 [Acidimicrobiia bacterium]|nr:hypothetical protein [Acidimicrobiia bacterium]